MLSMLFFFFKQRPAYEMRISDWSSDVCSSDLLGAEILAGGAEFGVAVAEFVQLMLIMAVDLGLDRGGAGHRGARSHRGGRRAEGEARDVPQGLERGRAHAAFCDHRVEESAVPFFLFGHMRDFASHRVAVAHPPERARTGPRPALFSPLIRPH